MTQTLEQPARTYLTPQELDSATEEPMTGQVNIINDSLEVEDDEPIQLVVGNLPPSAPDVFSVHDLRAEAESVLDSQYAAKDRLLDPVLTTLLTVSDATLATRALSHSFAAMRLTRDYGEAAHKRVLEKAVAITDVNMAKATQNAERAIRHYNRLRVGAVTSDEFTDLKLGDEGVEHFIRPPLHEIGPDPLVYTVEEFDMVLAATRIMALIPRHAGEDVEAWDFLSRATPSHSERAFYQAKVEQAGVKQNVAHLPKYNAGLSATLQ